jgi:aminoglycoside phosphotransferase (APT) family kinase protein
VASSEITSELVGELLREQLPQLGNLPLTPVELAGWDNVTFRLGGEYIVRLPSEDAYVPQVEKEQRWLPVLAKKLSMRIPEPVGVGVPSERFPRPWSVYRWLPGAPLSQAEDVDAEALVDDLAAFLSELQAIDAADGPAAGSHSFHRGAPVATYDDEARDALARLGDRIDLAAALSVWESGCSTAWKGPPRWLHGDLAPSNLLVSDGRLCAVIDFGCCAVGDPACDLVMAWTFFDHGQRAELRARLDLDADTWARGRAWALWKALITAEEIESAGDDPAPRFGWRGNTWDVLRRVIDATEAEPA